MIDQQFSVNQDITLKKDELSHMLQELLRPVLQTAFDIIGDYTNEFGITLVVGGGLLMWLIIYTTMGAGDKIGSEPPIDNINEQEKEEEQKKKKEEEKEKKKQLELEEEMEKLAQKELEEIEKQEQEEEKQFKKEEEKKEKLVKKEKLEIEKSQKDKEKFLIEQENKTVEQMQQMQEYRIEKQNNIKLDFDWNNQGDKNLSAASNGINLKYKPNSKDKENITSLSVLMTDLTKLMESGFKNNDIAIKLSEKAKDIGSAEELVQVIEAVREFVNLANSNKNLLEKFSNGDLNVAIEVFSNQLNEVTTAGQGSKIASFIGALAYLNGDKGLAIDSFAKAVEFAPDNVGAWGRLGDAYLVTGNPLQAEQSYSKVLTYGNFEKNTFQMGKAFEKLGAIQTAYGNKPEAKRLLDESKKYYQKLGVSTSVTAEEKFALSNVAKDKNRVSSSYNVNDYILFAEQELSFENEDNF